MYISKNHIKGYRNFKDKEINFREGINVIIGPNNAGKSNLLIALDLVLNTETTKKLSLYDFCRVCTLDELKAAPPQVRISVFFSESEGEAAVSEDETDECMEDVVQSGKQVSWDAIQGHLVMEAHQGLWQVFRHLPLGCHQGDMEKDMCWNGGSNKRQKA